MPNILSQAEIDELLNALSSGEEDESQEVEADVASKVRPYDFRSASRFPKEQMRTLNIVFQTFSQLFSNHLTGVLRTSCECEVLSVEELTFNEFNNSLPIPIILAILNVPQMQGSLLLEISPEAAYMIISRLLGGSKSGGDSSKQFTEIELALMERVMRQAMHVFDEAWDKIIRLHTQLDRLETSPQFAQIVALNEPVAVVMLNLMIGSESGLVSLCMPHSALEPISKQLSTRTWLSGSQEVRKVEGQSDIIGEKLIHSEVNMTAYFEETAATVVDIANLQIGDVIRLNQKTADPLLIKVQHIPKFRAKVGTSGSRYAMQITDIIKEENEDESFPGRD